MGRPFHQLIHAARRNGNRKGQYPGSEGVNSDQVVDWLAAAVDRTSRSRVRRQAKVLLEFMADGLWRVSSGLKSGGIGDRWRGPDPSVHATVTFGRGRSYHLKLDASRHLWRITGPGIPAIHPWAAPGTEEPLE